MADGEPASLPALVVLANKRNRGWPWPEDSFGLTPMYGERGWCRSCAVPRGPQIGDLVVQAKDFGSMRAAWVPHWRHDALCLERSLAQEAAQRFRITLRDVSWRGTSPGPAKELVVPPVGKSWFDARELADRLIDVHGTPGATCPECGVWRWMPLGFAPVPPMTEDVLPPLRRLAEFDDIDVAASPEWFGDGLNSFRLVLMHRGLAELIAFSTPHEFHLIEPNWA